MACRRDGAACMVRLAGPVEVLTPHINLDGLTTEVNADEGPACRECGNCGTYVQGTVIASARVVADPTPVLARMPNPLLSTTLAHCPYVKLRVSSSQWRGPVWIDSGRGIVVPSPHACLGIVAPDGWREVTEGEVISALNPGATFTLWEVWLQIKLCCAPCCGEGDPILTDSHNVPANTDVEFIVPRGARECSITNLVTANGTVTGRWTTGGTGGITLGSFNMGTAAFANFRPEHYAVVPDADRLVIRSTVTMPCLISWRVAP